MCGRVKLAGLDLSASRSGKNAEKIIPKLSKKGNATLRMRCTRQRSLPPAATGILSSTSRG